MIEIRPYRPADWEPVWSLLQPIFRAGETYVFAPEITESEARRIWTELPQATYVATLDGTVVGTYFLKPNQPGLGDHVCNCGYAVSAAARGHGVASQMCEHSQAKGVALGFHAMQFNFVVSTNEGAVRLWKRLGFEVVGTLPEAFRHPRLGFVDALVMFKKLGTA